MVLLFKNKNLKIESEQTKSLKSTGEVMLRIILLQFVVAIVIALASLFIFDLHAGISAILGGLSCAIPNAFFALRLYANSKKGTESNPMNFFVGEFIKIGLTLTLLAVVVVFYQELNWMAFIASFILVLKSYLILLFRY